jgi:outer membrane protein assembly factor BamA
MPIFIRVCDKDHRTQWVLGPSVTRNAIIHYSATVRFYAYPDPDTTYSMIVGASTRINYRISGMRQHFPRDVGALTEESILRVERNAFARFYGLGMDSPESGQSTYTAEHAFVTHREGINVAENVNLGATLGFDREAVLPQGVMGLPLTTDEYPLVPGVRAPSIVLRQGFDVRYDTRKGGDYAESGIRLDAGFTIIEGIRGSPTFVRGELAARYLFPELSWLSGAARFYYAGVSAQSAPFYLQSELGGGSLLRGFSDGRFYANQTWTAELEQRIRVYRTTLMGVVADWRIDPFVAVGQVFDSGGQIIANPQFSAGAGIRIFVHPNIVGRIDLAEGGEGLKTYVEIGYPY